MKKFFSAVFLLAYIVPLPAFAVTYDAVIAPGDITPVPANPKVNELVKIYATIKSAGTLDLEGLAVFNDGNVLISRKAYSIKAGGAQEDVWAEWTPTTGGLHTITVTAVNDPGYPEATPQNNSASITVNVESPPPPSPPPSSPSSTTATNQSTTNRTTQPTSNNPTAAAPTQSSQIGTSNQTESTKKATPMETSRKTASPFFATTDPQPSKASPPTHATTTFIAQAISATSSSTDSDPLDTGFASPSSTQSNPSTHNSSSEPATTSPSTILWAIAAISGLLALLAFLLEWLRRRRHTQEQTKRPQDHSGS